MSIISLFILNPFNQIIKFSKKFVSSNNFLNEFCENFYENFEKFAKKESIIDNKENFLKFFENNLYFLAKIYKIKKKISKNFLKN